LGFGFWVLGFGLRGGGLGPLAAFPPHSPAPTRVVTTTHPFSHSILYPAKSHSIAPRIACDSLVPFLTLNSPPSLHHSYSSLLPRVPPPHVVTQSHSHTVTQSHSHTVTQSHSHTVTQSHSHTVRYLSQNKPASTT